MLGNVTHLLLHFYTACLAPCCSDLHLLGQLLGMLQGTSEVAPGGKHSSKGQSGALWLYTMVPLSSDNAWLHYSGFPPAYTDRERVSPGGNSWAGCHTGTTMNPVIRVGTYKSPVIVTQPKSTRNSHACTCVAVSIPLRRSGEVAPQSPPQLGLT